MAQVSRSLHVGSLGTATLNYSVNICLGQRMDSTAAKSDKYSYWDSDSSLHPPKQIHKMLNEKKHFTDLKGITEKKKLTPWQKIFGKCFEVNAHHLKRIHCWSLRLPWSVCTTAAHRHRHTEGWQTAVANMLISHSSSSRYTFFKCCLTRVLNVSLKQPRGNL